MSGAGNGVGLGAGLPDLPDMDLASTALRFGAALTHSHALAAQQEPAMLTPGHKAAAPPPAPSLHTETAAPVHPAQSARATPPPTEASAAQALKTVVAGQGAGQGAEQPMAQASRPAPAASTALPLSLQATLAAAGYGRASVAPVLHPPEGAPVRGHAPGLVQAAALALLADMPPLRSGKPPQDAPLRRDRQPPSPALWLFPEDASGEILSYSDDRPVAIDLAPFMAEAPAWRLDDTQVRVMAGTDRAAASRRAMALHAALLDQDAGAEAIRPGEGVSTWEGSPLWLHLAGIAKPEVQGVLLAESAPARLVLTRLGATSWRVERTGGRGMIVQSLSAVLYGDPTAELARNAWAALRAAILLTPPDRARVQEAWAAVLRGWGRAARGGADPAELALLRAVSAGRTEADPLPSIGRAVLQRVCAGEVQGVGAREGVALAVALGRLRPGPMQAIR